MESAPLTVCHVTRATVSLRRRLHRRGISLQGLDRQALTVANAVLRDRSRLRRALAISSCHPGSPSSVGSREGHRRAQCRRGCPDSGWLGWPPGSDEVGVRHTGPFGPGNCGRADHSGYSRVLATRTHEPGAISLQIVRSERSAGPMARRLEVTPVRVIASTPRRGHPRPARGGTRRFRSQWASDADVAVMKLRRLVRNSLEPAVRRLSYRWDTPTVTLPAPDDALQAGYHSQFGQDLMLDRHIFAGLAGGIFADVGAYDGVTHSNSYFLEQHRGWSGVCVEANPEAFVACKAARSSPCVHAAICETGSTAEFLHRARQLSDAQRPVCVDGRTPASAHRSRRRLRGGNANRGRTGTPTDRCVEGRRDRPSRSSAGRCGGR